MYGFVAEALVAWIKTREHGENELKTIVDKAIAAGIDMNVQFNTAQSDADTLAVVGITCEVLEMTAEDILYQIGYNQLPPLIDKGYLPVVQSLGSNFFDMVNNLDTMHTNYAQIYPSMVGPSFKAYRNEDDTMTIHYYSSRVGIAPYAKGLLTALAEAAHGLQVSISHLQQRGDDGHDIFKLTFTDSLKAFGDGDAILRKHRVPLANGQLEISSDSFDNLFPWHVAFDSTFSIISVGKHMAGRFSKSMVGRPLDDVLRLVRPLSLNYSFTSDNDYDDAAVIYTVVQEQASEPEIRCPITGKVYKVPKVEDERYEQTGVMPLKDNLFMRGQLMYEKDMDALVFLGIPALADFEEMKVNNIALDQFPVHSSGRDMLFAATHSMATLESTKQLESLTAELDVAMKELDSEKARIHDLLHSILPPAIAESLSTGVTPDAERYDRVSILFSDIVGFTKISSSVPPNEVMAMLNELFSKFDALCEKYDVFKVETIGDAYMVASGLPRPTEKHADNLAGFAIEMVACAEEVMSPMDGEPLQIRVGMHAGPCMAGVVGKQRPRYCLFGDSVNTASRMESTGVPATIQTSYAFIKSLTNRDNWNTMTRGLVKVKGKGEMKTYFLLGSKGSPMQLTPPDASVMDPTSSVATPPVLDYGSHSPAPFDLPALSSDSQPRRLSTGQGSSLDLLTAALARAAKQPQPVPQPEAKPGQDAVFTVEVVMEHDDLLTVPFAPGSMTLQELIDDLVVATDTSVYRMFMDAKQKQMLLPRMSLHSLHKACVNANVLKATSKVVKVYLGRLQAKTTAFV
nr:soluble guanylate cyclase 4 [Choanoeca flexa]|eukprot:TRINITY_DN11295_c0_g2_i3.p1 TRINITY_DN11295_c0_g2~~TRINITY_DN11295_c0_g2_i3.p1  ORF type:complete len:799 (+),score=202.73 TRINITY_DN11295_c0_g2_i3:108-2504(+)